MPDSSPDVEDEEEEEDEREEVRDEGRTEEGSWAPLSLLTSMPRKAVGAHIAMAHGLKF